MHRLLISSAILSIALGALGATSASAAVPACVGMGPQKVIYSDQGSLESVIVGGGGKLFYSGTPAGSTAGRLYSSSGPGAAPAKVIDNPGGPGGLAWSGKRLLWGYGDSVANGNAGDLHPTAGLWSVNPVNSTRFLVSDHLGMANGIARGRDGTIYASNNFGLKLDRITGKGKKFTTENGWASLESANGLTVGKNGRFLYANQMFESPSTIAMVDTKDRSRIFTYFTSPEPANVLFDGLARDNDNNLYAAVFGLGQVWKITPDKQACVLATGLSNTSSVAISTAKKGFRAGNLYAVGFDGKVVEVRAAVNAVVPAT